jgi:hypothetical protein
MLRLDNLHALGSETGDRPVEIGDAQSNVIDDLPARAHERSAGVFHPKCQMALCGLVAGALLTFVKSM